jgi:hypothetical protein
MHSGEGIGLDHWARSAADRCQGALRYDRDSHADRHVHQFVGIDPIKALFWGGGPEWCRGGAIDCHDHDLDRAEASDGAFTLRRPLWAMGWLSTVVMAVALAAMFSELVSYETKLLSQTGPRWNCIPSCHTRSSSQIHCSPTRCSCWSHNRVRNSQIRCSQTRCNRIRNSRARGS